MCGICGLIQEDRTVEVSPDLIERMKDTLAHRGPDDHGTYVEPGVGLGFRRLSIIDLSGGHQPMCNEDGSVWIVFNGEIYNHSELRPRLEGRGHQFRTRCDTETIIHLYEEEGVEGFAALNGMFAFCIWDRRRERAVIVRDRLGIKPLYYRLTDHGMVFGSEIKAMLEADPARPSLDPEAVEEFLLFRFVAGERTLFRDIRSVAPGEVLIYEQGDLKRRYFWKLPERADYLDGDETALTEELAGLLDESVSLRLMSDVPVGAFCSGGIDSGLTTAYATEHGLHGIDTFSVGFREADFDETRYAKLVSDRYETRHHELTINNQTFSESLPKIIWYNDEPLNHANSVPIHHIARLARQFVTVVLTGEGADELFAGYPRYNIAKIWTLLGGLPRSVREQMNRLTGLMGSRRLRKLGAALPLGPAEVALFNSAFLTSDLTHGFLPYGAPPPDLSFRRSFLENPSVGRNDLLDRLWRLDLRTYLVSLLNRMDKMTMAASIEARVPFLDHKIVEWALRVPPSFKLRGFKNKHLVRRLGLAKLPHEVVNRSKSGFGVPVGRWFRERQFLGRYLDFFFDDRFRGRDYLNVSRVRALVRDHLDGRRDHGEAIWNLVNLELWHRIFLEGDLGLLDQESHTE
jgi:asparagine synthase (glutamine-hydrolysing)